MTYARMQHIWRANSGWSQRAIYFVRVHSQEKKKREKVIASPQFKCPLPGNETVAEESERERERKGREIPEGIKTSLNARNIQ